MSSSAMARRISRRPSISISASTRTRALADIKSARQGAAPDQGLQRQSGGTWLLPRRQARLSGRGACRRRCRHRLLRRLYRKEPERSEQDQMPAAAAFRRQRPLRAAGGRGEDPQGARASWPISRATSIQAPTTRSTARSGHPTIGRRRASPIRAASPSCAAIIGPRYDLSGSVGHALHVSNSARAMSMRP